MDISSRQIDLAVLLMALVGLVFTAWLYRRFPRQFWYEKRLPWLFPKNLLVVWETMTQEHPFRYTFVTFLSMLGLFAIANDIGCTLAYSCLGPLIRYVVAAGIAVFSLYTHRANAARRAQDRGGGGHDG